LGLVFLDRETTAEPTTEQLVEVGEVSHKLALVGLGTQLEKVGMPHLTRLQELLFFMQEEAEVVLLEAKPQGQAGELEQEQVQLGTARPLAGALQLQTEALEVAALLVVAGLTLGVVGQAG
jgi:hypothetical protein